MAEQETYKLLIESIKSIFPDAKFKINFIAEKNSYHCLIISESKNGFSKKISILVESQDIDDLHALKSKDQEKKVELIEHDFYNKILEKSKEPLETEKTIWEISLQFM